jgi:hypothetical protein
VSDSSSTDFKIPKISILKIQIECKWQSNCTFKSKAAIKKDLSQDDKSDKKTEIKKGTVRNGQ